MSIITYSSTVLKEMNKIGNLKPDKNGYYDLVLGAMNTTNSAGQYYLLSGCEKMFEDSSILMRRIRDGNCYGEYGHPRQKSRSRKDYFRRLLTVHEDKVGTHIREISLDSELWRTRLGKMDKGAVAVVGKVKPSGPYAESVESSILNPHENLAYSVRSFTKNTVTPSRTEKLMVELVTYDSVGAGGIPVASKWSSPGLEAMDDIELIRSDIEDVAAEVLDSDDNALEAEDVRYAAERILRYYSKEDTGILLPKRDKIYLDW